MFEPLQAASLPRVSLAAEHRKEARRAPASKPTGPCRTHAACHANAHHTPNENENEKDNETGNAQPSAGGGVKLVPECIARFPPSTFMIKP